MKRIVCRLRGHKWTERKPHRMWDMNTFDCTRCGAIRKAGFDGRGLTIRREVEVESGREHVWWTVADCASGYSKTFRDESEANDHAEVIRQRKARRPTP